MKLRFLLLFLVFSLKGMEQLQDINSQIQSLQFLLGESDPSSPGHAEIQNQLATLQAQKIQLEQILKPPAVVAATSPSKWFFTGDLIAHLKSVGKAIIADARFGHLISQESHGTKNPLSYLVSFQQVHGTCGYHALANAHAIQKLIKEKRPLTVDNIRRYAEQFFRDFLMRKKADKLEVCAKAGSDEIGEILVTASEPDVAVTPSVANGDTNFFVLRKSPQYLTQISPEAQQEFIASLLLNPVTHFLILDGGHFTELSVVKENGTYHMLYLDSANAAKKNQIVINFIQFVDGLIQQAKGRAKAMGMRPPTPEQAGPAPRSPRVSPVPVRRPTPRTPSPVPVRRPTPPPVRIPSPVPASAPARVRTPSPPPAPAPTPGLTPERELQDPERELQDMYQEMRDLLNQIES